ncbi:MAG: exodeoxyribonuclease VII large subunit [Burkholderiales bacterium]|nr:exodeoxyribonuclease VII large subunit [Burkholderiales bacterium]
MVEWATSAGATRVWQVGALCRAIADAMDARFNPVTVGGEISGFTKAASGHCYFSLKDDTGQIRCAMFRRAAGLLNFSPCDGDRVEVQGRLGVYESRGELQLVVESMRPAGQGTLFEQFFKLKAKLEREGLFESSRKRPLPVAPRGIGVVTSLGAAALHDVVTALQRRVPHIPVVLAPASVQGEGAPRELVQALSNLYALAQAPQQPGALAMDVILLVRGGGAMEDLWAFNDETLARTIACSPVPVVCGVGHETDFTIADFVADLRAPTPTAAAELAAQPTAVWLAAAQTLQARLQAAVLRQIDRQAQRLDQASSRLGRPSSLAHQQRLLLAAAQQRLQHSVHLTFQSRRQVLERRSQDVGPAVQHAVQRCTDQVHRAELRLGLLDPSLVLKRGYAWLSLEDGSTLTRVAQTRAGQSVRATLTDGAVDLTVAS